MFDPLGERFISFSHYVLLFIASSLGSKNWGSNLGSWYFEWLHISHDWCYSFSPHVISLPKASILSHAIMCDSDSLSCISLKQAGNTNWHYLAHPTQSHNICSHLCFIIYNCNWSIFVMNDCMALSSSWVMFNALVSIDRWYLFVLLCISLLALKKRPCLLLLGRLIAQACTFHTPRHPPAHADAAPAQRSVPIFLVVDVKPLSCGRPGAAAWQLLASPCFVTLRYRWPNGLGQMGRTRHDTKKTLP